jgi:hypothetical protein
MSRYRQHPYTLTTHTNTLNKINQSKYRLIYALCLVCLWILVSSIVSGCATTQSVMNDSVVIDQLLAILLHK